MLQILEPVQYKMLFRVQYWLLVHRISWLLWLSIVSNIFWLMPVIMKSIDYKQNTKNVIKKSPSISYKSWKNSRRYLTITLPQPTLYILNCFKFTKSYFSFLSAAAITVKNYDYRFL